MPLVYVGRVNKYFGRPLWEIVYNLKDFGVGRIVTRTTFKVYPEITYFRIVHAQPTIMEYPENFYGKLLVEKTFRGVTDDELYDIGRVAYKPDYILIPKHSEEAFMKSGKEPVKNTKIYPKYMTLPPLWQELIKREKAREKVQVTEADLRVPVAYKNTDRFSVAQDNEKPTFELTDFTCRHEHLYQDITIDKEKQKAVVKSI